MPVCMITDRCLNCATYHFDVVTFNGTLLFTPSVAGELPVWDFVAHSRGMWRYPLAAGQRYVLLHGTTVMRAEMKFSDYLDPSRHERIIVVRATNDGEPSPKKAKAGDAK